MIGVRSLATLPVNFELYENYSRGGGALWNVKEQVGASWRHSIRSRGGYWMATCDYEATPGEMMEMFLEGMAREVRLTVGGITVWQGFISKAVLTTGGAQWVRTWSGLANRIKVIYTRIGDNLLTNGSVESGAWASIGTPTTNEQSTAWVTNGVYSAHIVTNAANEGATIESALAISGKKAYDLRVSTRIISGTWELQIVNDTTSAIIASAEEVASAVKQTTMACGIDGNSTYSGNITIQLICTSATGEIYADNAIFQEGPVKAETGWADDAASQDEYGIIEDAILEGGMSDDSADALALTELAERAYIRTEAPAQIRVAPTAGSRLQLTLCGYVFTLRNKYAATLGTDTASGHVTTILTAAEFVSAGIIETNSMDYKVDERAELRGWEILNEIARAGDASGNRWNCGVYGGRLFDYNQADVSVQYNLRSGVLYNTSGGLAEPWFMLPATVRMDDMPIAAVGAGALATDDPRNVYMEEIEFSVADWLENKSGISLRGRID